MATDHEELDPRLRVAIDGMADREPANDLWPRIARKIASRPPGMLQLRWPMAAAAALLLLAGGAMLYRALGPDQPEIAMVDDSTASPAPSSESGLILPVGFDRAEQTLSEELRAADRRFAELADRLDPEARLALDQALEVLDSTINRARSRVTESPDDLKVAADLTAMLRKKLDVLNRVTIRLDRT